MATDVSPRRQNSPLRQAQAAATRLRIIEAAHAEFEARGYDGTRIEDVAAQAGVDQQLARSDDIGTLVLSMAVED